MNGPPERDQELELPECLAWCPSEKPMPPNDTGTLFSKRFMKHKSRFHGSSIVSQSTWNHYFALQRAEITDDGGGYNILFYINEIFCLKFNKLRSKLEVAKGCSNLLTGLSPGGVFDRLVNPISTRGGRLCPPQYYQHLRIFRPCDGPDLVTLYIQDSTLMGLLI